MASPSAVINRSLRAHVSPALRRAGFEDIDARNGLAWKGPCIRVLIVRAVGGYFSQVTGWPASSVNVWLGVHYTFIPPSPRIQVGEDGRLRPKDVDCQRRSHLERRSAGRPLRTLSNPAERERQDLWWLEPDGSNADDVAKDIAEAVDGPGRAWFEAGSDLSRVLAEVEAEHDCMNKYVFARYLARELGRGEVERNYEALAEREARRIGSKPEPGGWFPLYGR